MARPVFAARNEDDIVAAATELTLKDPVRTMPHRGHIRLTTRICPDPRAVVRRLAWPSGQLLQTRMELPAKGRHCSHIQCFDLRPFLSMNARRPTWSCAVCNKPVLFESLRIDRCAERRDQAWPNARTTSYVAPWSPRHGLRVAATCKSSCGPCRRRRPPSSSTRRAAGPSRPTRTASMWTVRNNRRETVLVAHLTHAALRKGSFGSTRRRYPTGEARQAGAARRAGQTAARPAGRFGHPVATGQRPAGGRGNRPRVVGRRGRPRWRWRRQQCQQRSCGTQVPTIRRAAAPAAERARRGPRPAAGDAPRDARRSAPRRRATGRVAYPPPRPWI